MEESNRSIAASNRAHTLGMAIGVPLAVLVFVVGAYAFLVGVCTGPEGRYFSWGRWSPKAV